ncbi:hypothetical protein Syun_003503 [Stephania yunnanensis]|uniref:pyruvate kinase n=1 Tax=Stephania yunnanensis TaxID=152371 RepID=A0AAP0L1J7_9MAGN
MASILEPSKLSFFPAMPKIVGTLGPKSRSVEVISECLKSGMSEFLSCNDEDRRDARSKSRSVEVISECLKSGMSVARFDFSWGDAEYHQETFENLKIAIKTTKKLCAGLAMEFSLCKINILNPVTLPSLPGVYLKQQTSEYSSTLSLVDDILEQAGRSKLYVTFLWCSFVDQDGQELTQTTPDQPVDDEAVYYKVAGDYPKGCVYSLRSLWRNKRRYVDPDASTSQVLAQRGMSNFMILSTSKQLLEGVQAMEQVLWLYFQV